MKIIRYILFTLTFPLWVKGQEHAPLRKELSHILASYVDSGLIPGAVLQVQYKRKIIYQQAAGYARRFDPEGQKLKKPERLRPAHLYDIASLTKVTGTTTAIMLLTDQGKLHPDDRVGKFIPAFNSADKKEITIRQLLTHTSGLLEWYPLYYRANTKLATYGLIGSLPLKYPVGKERHYSDLGFAILGQIIETVSGMSLDTFELENIFRPLGMTQTLYTPVKNNYKGVVVPTSFGNPYEYRMVHDSSLGFVFKEINPDQWNGWRNYLLRGEVNDGNCWYACEGVNGAAGLFSTAGDLQLLVNMLLNKEPGGLISKKTRDLFLTKDQFNNGLGWMMDPVNSFMKNAPESSFGHTGFTGTSIAVVPSMELSVILLINRQQRGLLPSNEYYNLNPLRRRIFETIVNALK
ncbi:MAG TPA: serine hydrolase [Chitinophagaceae bacterium]|jgi:CubicO group peptidase (beta-lactamase class C family)|nr:serine hydrolase [Chitinophagaceae bacterium]